MFNFSECITRINQVLNYPALTYTDISHFFDQAISEINTSFKIKLPLVSQMIDENRLKIYEMPNVIPISETDNISVSSEKPSESSFKVTTYCTADNLFYTYSNAREAWVGYKELYGVHAPNSEARQVYRAIAYRIGDKVAARWSQVDSKSYEDFDLNIYLPTDWIILFIIPYVCFKVAVRDGAEGSLYNEEFVQGFQQLQTSYDVPNMVCLRDVAHLPAYTPIVKSNLANIESIHPTRAVYDSMKIGNSILPNYGGLYDSGGWGL